ncbi:type II toxin-antitoxin system HigB family toxin [Microcoleus sp. T3B2]
MGGFTVFNIKGNNYRLIVSIDYESQLIYIKYILTHAEYDKEKWKNDPYF